MARARKVSAPLAADPPPRPRRGAPADTRLRLLQAAAEVFNRVGYEGTDSNRLAREAGYSAGTFYKHFADKRTVFLAVYEEWVAREWEEIGRVLSAAGAARQRAEQIVGVFLAHHARWRGVRSSLRALVATDTVVADFYRAQRRVQLDRMVTLSAGRRHKASREADVLLLYTLERAADALADGEATALGLRPAALRLCLVELVIARIRT